MGSRAEDWSSKFRSDYYVEINELAVGRTHLDIALGLNRCWLKVEEIIFVRG